MGAIKQIVRIPKNHKIGIKIPHYVPENEMVEVILIIKKMPDSFKQKIEELKEAVRDDLFLDDLVDVSEDFMTVDSEGWA
ncbi:MAG: hypothetical protein J7J06_02445 [Methanosarcinales archaeon]|nr:hypothetical protein [Methanosarcinales archaeon]